jgi:hypothetical protein
MRRSSINNKHAIEILCFCYQTANILNNFCCVCYITQQQKVRVLCVLFPLNSILFSIFYCFINWYDSV